MKNLYFLFLVFPIVLSAQLNVHIDNAYFEDFEYRSCAYNDSVSLYLPVGWELYRTLNDKWNGVRDSTECIGLDPNEDGAALLLEGLSSDRPIFLRALLTDDNKQELTPNWVYGLDFYADYSNAIESDCNAGLCSKLIVGIEIPNADTTGTALRIYEGEFDEFERMYTICLGTEYFEKNYLREVVYQLKINPDPNVQISHITFRSFRAEVSPYVMPLPDTIIAPEWAFDGDSTYNFPLDFGWYSNYLVTHDETSYPQPGNTTYIEVDPAIPSASQQTINISIAEYAPLTFAPFASIRGTTIEGSDSIRHKVNLWMPEYNYCLPFIDVAFSSSVSLFPGIGGIDLPSVKSCYSFSHGARMVIASGRDVVYGKSGVGILALNVDGGITLQPNSSLMINNELRLPDHHGLPSDQTWVELPRGSRLSFGPLGRINKIGTYAETGYMKLNVFMNGGELDDHLLSPKERSYINRIYPANIENPAQPLRILPNPSSETLTFEMTLPKDSNYDWSIIDINGRKVKNGEDFAQKGRSYHSIPIQKLLKGVYFLQVQAGAQVLTGKVLVD